MKSLLYKPWHLVRHNGQLKLAYLTKGFGGGAVPGPAMGGRGHLTDDYGRLTEEVVVFPQSALLYDWVNRPTETQFDKAVSRELATA